MSQKCPCPPPPRTVAVWDPVIMFLMFIIVLAVFAYFEIREKKKRKQIQRNATVSTICHFHQLFLVRKTLSPLFYVSQR